MSVAILPAEKLQDSSENYFWFGWLASALGHAVIGAYIFLRLFPTMGEFSDPIVYSVTIEGGKSLGAMSQVPKDDQKTAIAPPKNVTGPEEPPPPKVEEKKEKAIEEKKLEEKKPEEKPNDAEVSINDKPKPTAPPKKEEKKEEAKKEKEKTAKKTEDPKEKPKEQKPKDPNADVDKRLQAALQRYLGESSNAGGKGFGAAKLGSNGMGGGVVRPPEFFVYEKLIRSRIKDAWRWYDTSAALITQLSFDIDPDGTIRNVMTVKSSGNSEFDDSVVRAVRKASPLPPPPESVYQLYFKSVRITFDPRE